MTSPRLSKVAEAIKQEVAIILQQELKDPRIGFVTITRVEVTPDLSRALVYFSLLESHGDAAKTLEGLKSAQGFMRKLVGERLKIRITPEIVFRAEPFAAENIRISKLLEGLSISKPESNTQESSDA